MKTQILFDNGKMQLLLVPETKAEKSLIEALHEDQPEFNVWTSKGQFTDRVGGYAAHSLHEDHSMIISVNRK